MKYDPLFDRTKKVGGCWVFLGSTNNGGYGVIKVRSHASPQLVHRLAWERTHGPIPAGLHVHHRCGVRLCVNPSHMELLSAAEHRRRHAAADS